jgi:hypothetical protein
LDIASVIPLILFLQVHIPIKIAFSRRLCAWSAEVGLVRSPYRVDLRARLREPLVVRLH